VYATPSSLTKGELHAIYRKAVQALVDDELSQISDQSTLGDPIRIRTAAMLAREITDPHNSGHNTDRSGAADLLDYADQTLDTFVHPEGSSLALFCDVYAFLPSKEWSSVRHDLNGIYQKQLSALLRIGIST